MSWKSIIKTVAPTLATALGGPLGGMAVSAIANAVLPEDEVKANESNPTKLESLVKSAVLSPGADLAKIKEADQKFEARMTELGIDLERVHQEDRASARRRQEETGDNTPAILAYMYTVGFFGILFILIFYGDMIKPSVSDMLKILLGVFVTLLTGAKEYFFGSSAGSARKNVLLSKSGK